MRVTTYSTRLATRGLLIAVTCLAMAVASLQAAPPSGQRGEDLGSLVAAAATQPQRAFDLDVYVLGSLTGELEDNLWALTRIVAQAEPRSEDISGPVLVSGSGVPKLSTRALEILMQAYQSGWPVGVIDADAEQINGFYRALGSDREFIMPEGVAGVDGVVVDRGIDNAVATFYGSTKPLDDTPEDGGSGERVHDRRAAAILSWIVERMPTPQGAQTEDPPKELDHIHTAWRDVAFFEESSGSYQITTLLWGAHSLETKDDYYYIKQYCIFNPEKGFDYRSGFLYRPKPFTDVSWDSGKSEKYCRTMEGGACEYKDYVLKYEIFTQPEPGHKLVQLVKASPDTEISREVWTTGVTWSIGGKFIAGLACGKGCKGNVGVEVNAGMTLNNSRQIVKNDVTVKNRSLSRSSNQAGWEYSMPEVHSEHTGFCFRGLSRPKDAQIYTFQPENHAIWISDPTLREQAKGLKLRLDFNVTYARSLMYAIGPPQFYIDTYCNLIDCDCAPRTTPYTSLNSHWLTLPFPNVEKKP